MVKRLRRRPLTAESGVRFPMGVPIKASCGFFYFGDVELKNHGIELSVKKNNAGSLFFSAGVKAHRPAEHIPRGAIPHGGTN